MKIVHVADFVSEKLGYQELLLAKWNARHGHQVTLVTSDLNPPAPNYGETFEPLLGPRRMSTGETSHEGVRIVRLPARVEWRTRIWIKGLGAAVSAIDPDFVFAHGTMSPTSIAVARMAGNSGTPTFLDNHMVYSAMDTTLAGRATYAASRIFMRRYMARRVTAFYGVAQECVDFLVDAQGVPRQQARLLPLGVDTDLFAPDRLGGLDARREWGVPADAIVIGQTGKLEPSKDPLTLARACAPLARVDPRVHLVLVGGGPADYLAAVRSAFLEEAEPTQFHQLPAVAVNQLARVFSACDIVVFPGGTSMSSLEAAACSLPVCMNDLPASTWRASLGVGQTFPTGNHLALSQLLDSLVNDERTRAAAGRSARSAVLTQFSYDKVASDLERDAERALGWR